MSDALIVAMMGRRATNVALDAARQWEEHAEELQGQVNELRQTTDALRAELSRLRGQHKAALMHTAGLEAQKAHLIALGANAGPAWEMSGHFFKNGNPKTNVRLIYEAAFDAKGREIGVATPEKFRVD